jgi:hypothetical protein
MLINEVAGAAAQAVRLAALAEFLAGRAEDQAATKTISIQTFIKLANNMGISINDAQLRDLIQQPPLSNVIANIEGDAASGKIIFQGSEQSIPGADQEMTPDMARQTVDHMSKSAMNKRI